MNYPLISEYIEAIKAAEDNFEELKSLRLVLDSTGEPVMAGGNFAVVFKMKDEQTGKLHAVKCFLKEQEGRAEAYRMIAEELEFVNSTFLTPVRYLEKELFVDTNNSDETEFPVLLMDWVEGQTLDKYVRNHLDDQYELSLLTYQFSRLAMWLLPQPFAHGDLKPDNILVREDGTLVLVDYDGMYVPAMKGQKARELGSPDFRHPSRTEADFDEHIDDFSLISILLSLKAISMQPNFLEEYGASDRLLFSEKDYLNLAESKLMDAIKPMMHDSELATLYSLFILGSSQNNLSQVSFRLFNLTRPDKSQYEDEDLSTEVTKEDLENAWVDEFGVKYSQDRKRLLRVPTGLIKEYHIKKKIKIVCNDSFYYGSLTSIHIPDSVTSIGKSAFSFCRSLTSIHIPDSVTSIGERAFWGCESLTSIHIPDSVTSIEEKAFSSCGRLTSIHIPDSVTSIGEEAFFGCGSLISIHIPDNLTDIGILAFSYCESLTSLHIPDSVTSIGKKALWGCKSLASLHIPDSVTSIGDYAFYCCKNLTSIPIPDSVTSIGERVFWGCESLTSIHISDSMTSIEFGAFYGCRSLTSIHIPDSVTSIGDSAFADCSSLTAITVSEYNEKYDNRDNCNAIIDSGTNKLIVGCRNTVIPDSVTSIGERAFFYCRSLTSIHIPDSVTSIGEEAFWGCKSLASLHIPDSVTSIGASAFSGCGSLTSIHIPDSVTSIGEGAFRGCESLTSIHISDSMTSIGDSAFYGCRSLTSIHIPDSVTSIGDSAFADCESLTSIRIPDSVISIGYQAFLSCESLTSIHIPDSVTSIEEKAFSCCGSLTSIRIPDSVTSIGKSAFSFCRSLTSIHIPDSVTSIGDYAFADCRSLTSIHIPDSVTSIGEGAFAGCTSLTSIYIPIGTRNKFEKLLPKLKDKLVEQ